MTDAVILKGEGEFVTALIPPDYRTPYSGLVRFLRQQLPGVWLDWVAVKEAYRFARGRAFPIGRRRADGALDERAKVRFSADGLTAFLLLYAPRPQGRRIAELDLLRLVLSYGIPSDLLDAQAVRMTYLRRAYGETEPIARGRPPVDGAPAHIEWDRGVPTDAEGFLAALEASDDQVADDFLVEVRTGQSLGALHAPEPGIPGLSVRGTPLAPRAGADPTQFGEGIEVSPDHSTLRARKEGHLRILGVGGTRASVVPLLRVRDPKDLEPWAQRVFPGSMIVEGDLEVRFPVRVLGDVEIRGGLVRSSLEVMGSLFVRDGVIHHGRGPVKVGGVLSAAFLDRAWVQAHTVHVRRYSLQSRILAQDTVSAKAKAANICGGQVASRVKIEVATLGAPSAMATEVILANPSFTATFQSLYQAWSEALRAPATEAEGVPEDLRAAAAQWELAAQTLGQPSPSSLRITSQKVHAGVTVRIAGATREIGNTTGPVLFAYERMGDRDRVAMIRE